jgi:hypothetical protein
MRAGVRTSVDVIALRRGAITCLIIVKEANKRSRQIQAALPIAVCQVHEAHRKEAGSSPSAIGELRVDLIALDLDVQYSVTPRTNKGARQLIS